MLLLLLLKIRGDYWLVLAVFIIEIINIIFAFLKIGRDFYWLVLSTFVIIVIIIIIRFFLKIWRQVHGLTLKVNNIIIIDLFLFLKIRWNFYSLILATFIIIAGIIVIYAFLIKNRRYFNRLVLICLIIANITITIF